MQRSLTFIVATAAVLLAGCDRGSEPSASDQSPSAGKTLREARQGFATKLLRKVTVGEPVPKPPPHLFLSVAYPSPIGEMAAYVSPSPGDGRKHPAIIWIVGGFANSVSEIAWQPGPAQNDQSGSAFREAGIVMMYPSLRGGNNNPGCLEGFYGEVDDVLAAADFLATLDYVDPRRVYLGGHSTGGTLALLVAESTDRFRSVFSFGPVGDIRGYGQEHLPFSISDRREAELRSPVKWLHAIRNPTFVFEGTGRGNIDELKSLARAAGNPALHFYPIKGADHFGALAPVSRLIAAKMLRDDGPSSNISFTDGELTETLRK